MTAKAFASLAAIAGVDDRAVAARAIARRVGANLRAQLARVRSDVARQRCMAVADAQLTRRILALYDAAPGAVVN